MTDTYGTDPHEHERDVSREHEVHEPPSEYEFSDPYVSEEHSEEEAAAPLETAPARRSPLLPIVAAVGGVVLLGAVAWWQFGSALVSGHTDIANNPPTLTSLPLATPPAQIGDKNAPSVLQDMAAGQSPLTPVTPKVAAAELAPLPAPAPVAPVATVPVAAMPTAVSSAPAVQPTAAATVPVAPVVAHAVVSAAQTQSNEVVEQRISALTARIEDLQKKLDQTSTQLNQVANVATANIGGDNSAAKTKDLQDRLDKLERRVTAVTACNGRASSTTAACPRTTAPTPGARCGR